MNKTIQKLIDISIEPEPRTGRDRVYALLKWQKKFTIALQAHDNQIVKDAIAWARKYGDGFACAHCVDTGCNNPHTTKSSSSMRPSLPPRGTSHERLHLQMPLVRHLGPSDRKNL